MKFEECVERYASNGKAWVDVNKFNAYLRYLRRIQMLLALASLVGGTATGVGIFLLTHG